MAGPRRSSLQRRIVLSVLVGLATILLLFGVVASWVVEQSKQAVFAERLLLAQLIATHVDETLGARGPRDGGLGALLADRNAASPGPGVIPHVPDVIRVDVLDQSGLVRASSRPGRLDRPGEHRVLLGLGQEQSPAAAAHESRGDAGGRTHSVAYAPLAALPGWGVMVEQDEDVALGLPADLQRRLALFGVLALALASLLAWFDVRRVVRPLLALTAASERIAAGDLTTPISVERRDEVGVLARALDSMRTRLRASQSEIERWNLELEGRVGQRTEELRAVASENARLLAEVQAKEAQRRQLLEKCLWAQEEERRRVARELHDEIGQGLTALVMGLASAEETLLGGPTRERLAAIRELTSGTLVELRRVMLDLRPSLLDDLGLVAALGWYLERHVEGTGVAYVLEPVGFTRQDRLPPQIETALFRVVQEAVNNTLKHAQARTLQVRLRRCERAILTRIHDDGCGFDPQALPGDPGLPHGLGLLGMEERVTLLGGRFRLRSRPGWGTSISVRVPLDGGEDG